MNSTVTNSKTNLETLSSVFSKMKFASTDDIKFKHETHNWVSCFFVLTKQFYCAILMKGE